MEILSKIERFLVRNEVGWSLSPARKVYLRNSWRRGDETFSTRTQLAKFSNFPIFMTSNCAHVQQFNSISQPNNPIITFTIIAKLQIDIAKVCLREPPPGSGLTTDRMPVSAIAITVSNMSTNFVGDTKTIPNLRSSLYEYLQLIN